LKPKVGKDQKFSFTKKELVGMTGKSGTARVGGAETGEEAYFRMIINVVRYRTGEAGSGLRFNPIDGQKKGEGADWETNRKSRLKTTGAKAVMGTMPKGGEEGRGSTSQTKRGAQQGERKGKFKS